MNQSFIAIMSVFQAVLIEWAARVFYLRLESVLLFGLKPAPFIRVQRTSPPCFRTYPAFALILCIAAAALPGSGKAQTHEDWTYNLGIYEVNIRQYTESGTFAAFEEHLDRLQDMGVGILWLMPIHPIGEVNRLGTLGSYYSVKDYRDVNPEFGTKEDFEQLVREIQNRGMYVLLDWVPNHTAWDNYLTEEHPEWYVTDSNGNFTNPPGTNWSDVIQLDFSRPGLREYMIDAMKYWVSEFGIDGFRFDAVSFVPDYFWEEALPELRALKPDIFLLAEDDQAKWHDIGFDMTFGWGMYGFEHGVLKRIADGDNDANDLHTYMNGQFAGFPPGAYRMYFTSNHDENSWHGTTRQLFGDASELFKVLTGTIHGMPLIYSGQEAGLDKRLAFFDKDLIPWQEHRNAEIYSTLLHLKRENQALWNGSAGGNLHRILTSNNNDVYAFLRSKNEYRVFVMYNLSDQEQTVTLSSPSFVHNYVGSYRDVFTDERTSLSAQESITIPAWGYLVYEGVETNTGVTETHIPIEFALKQNYPNPFNPVTNISYDLPQPAQVDLHIYNVVGQRVDSLVNNYQQPGSYTVSFDAGHLGSGMYAIWLTAGDRTLTRKMMLIK